MRDYLQLSLTEKNENILSSNDENELVNYGK